MAEVKTNKCFELADIDENVSCDELDNLAGVIQEVIYFLWEDVATWPELPKVTEAPLTLEAAGKWVGDVAMKEGCRAYKFVCTEDTAELKITDQGEVGGESCLYELDVTRSKMSATLFGFENATRGRRMGLIVTDKNGNHYLMGDKLNAAHRVAGDGSTTGKATTDMNKSSLKFTYSCPRKLIYDGDISTILTPAPAAIP